MTEHASPHTSPADEQSPQPVSVPMADVLAYGVGPRVHWTREEDSSDDRDQQQHR